MKSFQFIFLFTVSIIKKLGLGENPILSQSKKVINNEVYWGDSGKINGSLKLFSRKNKIKSQIPSL